MTDSRQWQINFFFFYDFNYLFMTLITNLRL